LIKLLPEGVVYPVVIFTTGTGEYGIDFSISDPWGDFSKVRKMRENIAEFFARLGRADDHKVVLLLQGDKHEIGRIMRTLNGKEKIPSIRAA